MDFDGSGLVEVILRNNVGTALTMPLVEGTYQAYFDIPAGTFDGTNNRSIPTRVRLSSIGGLSSTGTAPDGEVEDYIYNFGPTAITFSRFVAEENTTWVAIAGTGLFALVSIGIILYRRRVVC
ncbi:MAG: GEVED domain-containing protein [Candidatus Promineifilaceae bacterium]